MIALTLMAAPSAMAAKPADVIQRSNGFPSGPHLNLNIHGKDPATFLCDSTPGGNSVFVPEWGPSTIEYVSNKRSSVTELVALDPCGVQDGRVQVQLPTKMEVVADDGSVTVIDTSEGYYVFGRILGKPGKDGEPNKILVSQTTVKEACNLGCVTDPDSGECLVDESGNTIYPDDLDCSGEFALGLIVGQNTYVATPESFERFDSTSDTGKGKSTAKNITDLFVFSGWVVDATADTNGDGTVDVTDVPADQDGDLDIDEDDLILWIIANNGVLYDSEWIFNIADLVVAEQDLNNEYTKLLQVRFYPVATTSFTP
jgi:hypothetical protein